MYDYDVQNNLAYIFNHNHNYIYKSKVSDRSNLRPEGSRFSGYYTEV